MEMKVNLVLLALLAVAYGGLTLAESAPELDPRQTNVSELVALEDAFAADHENPELARRLADRYLALREPQLVRSVLARTAPSVQRDPAVLHRLAQAYEQGGHMADALSTAQLAQDLCGRSLGTRDSSSVTPLPQHDCSERMYVALDQHAHALAWMVRMGVTDPLNDTRTNLAYSLSVRMARVSAPAPASNSAVR